MALKKKERVLTPAEMKEKQKRDYTPFWFNSEALFGGNLYPLAPIFSQQITILFLLDPADFSTERVIDSIEKWQSQYGKLPWDPVLVFQQKYPFMKNPKFFERFQKQKIFLDIFGELFERFGSQKEPVAVFLKNGEFLSSIPLLPDFPEMIFQVESQLQKSLRIEDPGLPLPSVEKVKFLSSTGQQTLSPEGVSTFGEWNGSKTFLVTEKNNSIISIPFKGKSLRLIAMAHPNSRDQIKVSITLNEKPLPIAFHNSVIHADSTGATHFEINKTTGLYDLMDSDVEMVGVVKITFLNAYDNGAVFYEFKIGS